MLLEKYKDRPKLQRSVMLIACVGYNAIDRIPRWCKIQGNYGSSQKQAHYD
jgi:hypothetical protein